MGDCNVWTACSTANHTVCHYATTHSPFEYCWALVEPRVILNTLRPRQDGRHFLDISNARKCINFDYDLWHSIKISLQFLPEDPINNIPALVKIMAWRRPGDKSLSVPMMVSLLTHICITRPQWVQSILICSKLSICCDFLVRQWEQRNICMFKT